MADDTQVSGEVPVTKTVDEVEPKIDAIKASNNGDVKVEKELKREEEETALDGEFIKVERSSGDSPSRDLLEAQEKARELEIELGRLSGALKSSESEISKLRSEVSAAKERIEETGKKCEDLEEGKKKLEKQFVESEEKYTAQVEALKEAAEAREALEGSKRRLVELEEELGVKASEAKKYEELHQKSGSAAEAEALRSSELERLVEEARSSAAESGEKAARESEKLRELCGDLEEKLKRYEESSTKVELALAEALSRSSELEKRLGSSEEEATRLRAELEGSVEAERTRVKELEEKIEAIEKRCSETESESKKVSNRATELDLELEAFRARSKSLEIAVREAGEKEKELVEALSAAAEEKKRSEAESGATSERLAETENLLESLRSELSLTQGRLESIGKDLEAGGARESEVAEKLSYAEAKLEEQGRLIDEANQKHSELEVLHESLKKDSEVKIQEATVSFVARDTEAKTLSERLGSLEEQVKSYEAKNEEQRRLIDETTQKRSELELLHESVKKDSEVKIQEATVSFAARDTEAKTLSEKLGVLEEQLKAHQAKLDEQARLVDETTQKHSELELLHESLKKDSEVKIQEATVSFTARDTEAKTLSEKLSSLEKQIKAYEVKIEEQGKLIDDTAQKHSELELLHESVKKDSEVKIQEATVSFAARDTEAKTLSEKLSYLEEQVKAHESKLEEQARLVDEKTQKHSELELLHESLKKESEVKIQEATLSFSARDTQAKTLSEKLGFLEEQIKTYEAKIEEQGRLIDETTQKHSELELLHESVKKDSDVKIQEVTVSFAARDTEAKTLSEKLSFLEEQVKSYEEQLVKEAGKSASLSSEIEEHKRKILESEEKSSQSLSEIELLVQTNGQLKAKVDELQELLNSAHLEKDDTTLQLEAHKSSVAELAVQHSRALELHSKSEAKLQDSVQKLAQREIEASELSQKLSALELQLSSFDTQCREASSVSESRKTELEETLLKLNQLESMVEELQRESTQFEAETRELSETNMKLTQELAENEAKSSDLQEKLSAALTEKEETSEKLSSSNKAVEDLMLQLATESEKLQSQIFSVMDENNLLNETYQSTKKELQSVILQLETELKENKENVNALKSESEIFKAEIAGKVALEARSKELEDLLFKTEARLKEEVESIQSISAQREADLTSKLEDHSKRVQDRDLLDEKLTQLQKDLHISHSTIAELKELHSQKDEERETAAKHFQEEVEIKKKATAELERHNQDLVQSKSQLEEAILKTEAQLKEEIESIKIEYAKRETDLASKLEDYAQKLQDKNVLDEQVVQLQRDLQLAQTTIAQLKDLHSQKDLEKDSLSKQSQEGVEESKKKTNDLEQQVKDLELKLKSAEAKLTEKAEASIQGEHKDGVEVKSRDIGLTFTAPTKRKGKKKSEAVSSQTSSSTETTHAPVAEHSPLMTIKLILGVAFVSVILGVILGKRY